VRVDFKSGNPALIGRILRRHAPLASSITAASTLAQWLWGAAFDRTYLVHALRFGRAHVPASSA
jgi:hypothetical protein